jgi:hypothetical protein
VVDFLDTSVFVEILDAPYMNDHRADVLAEMDVRLKVKVRFVLPTGDGGGRPETTSSRSRTARPAAPCRGIHEHAAGPPWARPHGSCTNAPGTAPS